MLELSMKYFENKNIHDRDTWLLFRRSFDWLFCRRMASMMYDGNNSRWVYLMAIRWKLKHFLFWYEMQYKQSVNEEIVWYLRAAFCENKVFRRTRSSCVCKSRSKQDFISDVVFFFRFFSLLEVKDGVVDESLTGMADRSITVRIFIEMK